MTTQTVQKELLDLETKYWDAMVRGDAKTAGRLSDDRTLVTGASGVMDIDRPTLEGMMAGGEWKLNGYKIDDFVVHPLRDDVVATGYKVREDLVVEGKPLTLEAYDSSVWLRNDSSWVCAVHTEAIAGDAFGRDRRA